jgi:subtilase family serine protease
MKIPSRQVAACTLTAAALSLAALSLAALSLAALSLAALGAGALGAGTPQAGVALRPGAVASASLAHALSAIKVTPAPLQFRGVKPDQVPLTTSQCEALFQIDCFLPNQLQSVYNTPYLYGKNITGTGETIVIVDAYGSPTISFDLSQFDINASIPDPPSLRILQPVGAVPAFDSTNGDMVGWAGETTLDVEYAHALAPGADIVLVEAPSDNFGTLLAADEYAISHRLGGVISQSWGEGEQALGAAEVRSLSGVFTKAAAKHITVLAASGDSGAANYQSNGNYYTYPVASWPATDPLVTAVGGTALHLYSAGGRLSPDTVWNDTYSDPINHFLTGSDGPSPFASGGGKSVYFSRPSYQNGVRNIVGSSRGIPDISMSSSCSAAVNIYETFLGAYQAGWYAACGTSEASPLFAGIIALADQAAGHWLGPVNPAIYKLEAEHAPGIIPVTSGNTTVTFTQNGHTYTIQGFSARNGYSLATGVGTVNAQYFVPELARLG